ncbi:MAG: diguanylate cyclase, partial [Candidatus Thiodiazotropha sp. (ex Lucinoma borealis)]|nr:diguanylate cyclase [Candidatus Thiodiazotropha sp. (ex Lucinoma borealis)]
MTTGYQLAEVKGEKSRFLESANLSKEVYLEIWKAIRNGQSWQGEYQNQKKNGGIFWEHANISPVLDESGKVCHLVSINEDITLRKQQEEHIFHQANFDALTGLSNRFLALDRLSQLINEAQRNKECVAVLFLDLDDFKKVNDTLGHDAGDKLLIEAATRLRSVVRASDTVGRLGGDEFIVLLSGITDAADAIPVAENILARFRDIFSVNSRELVLTTSIGIAAYPVDGNSASELLRNADSAMYHSKEQGRNTYSFFTDAMNQEVSRRLFLEEQLHGALERGEFRICYQPVIHIDSHRIVGFEALLRWHNPALGEVSPMEFIHIAEQTGHILPIGQYVLTRSLDRLAGWQQKYNQPFTMAINLSPRQFRDPNLVTFIGQAIHQAG